VVNRYDNVSGMVVEVTEEQGRGIPGAGSSSFKLWRELPRLPPAVYDRCLTYPLPYDAKIRT